MSVYLSVCLSLKISLTTEPIRFYSSRNIPTGPVVVLGYFLGGWYTPNPKKKQKIPPPPYFFSLEFFAYVLRIRHLFAKIGDPIFSAGYVKEDVMIGAHIISSWGKAPRG